MEKQIFAALEIADHEIRLVITEFHNTRFHVLKVERVECSCLQKVSYSNLESFQIKNKEEVVKTIQAVIADASKKLGVQITKVLLSVPSVGTTRVPVNVSDRVENPDGIVTPFEIGKTLKKAMNVAMSERHVLVNAVCSKFTSDGITTRKIPYNKVCNEYMLLIDLFKANRQLVFDLVACVEEAGCKVLDICLDSYAISKEASLLSQALEQNIVLVKLERDSTTIAYLSDNRLVTSSVVSDGYLSWLDILHKNHHLPKEIINTIILNNANLSRSDYTENVVYLWSKRQVKQMLTQKQLHLYMEEGIEKWTSMIKEASAQTIGNKKNKIVITGEGADLVGIAQYVEKITGCETKAYCSDTLGVRSSALTTCLGLFYAYKDQQEVLGNFESAINDEVVTQVPVQPVEEKQSDISDTNIKGLLKNFWGGITSNKGREE